MIELSVRNRNVGLCPVQEGQEVITQKKKREIGFTSPFRLVCCILFTCGAPRILQKNRLSLIRCLPHSSWHYLNSALPACPLSQEGRTRDFSRLLPVLAALSPFQRHTQEWLSLCVQVRKCWFWLLLNKARWELLKLNLINANSGLEA